MTHDDGHAEERADEDEVAVDKLSDGRALEVEERPHADSPNPTQKQIDEDPESDKPADVGWEGNAPDA